VPSMSLISWLLIGKIFLHAYSVRIEEDKE
jgi:hypothetical protein